MNKFIYTFLVLILFTFTLQAQAPEAFKYQTVIRDAAGEVLANQAVTLAIDLEQNGAGVYQEDHLVTTNAFGLANIEVGRGVVVSGDFSQIDWAVPTSIRVLLDPAGGTNLQDLGEAELLSVPYALYAANGGGGGDSEWSKDGNNISSSNSGNVGVGTTTPNRKLSVATNAASDGVMTVSNTNAAGFAGTYYESAGNTLGLIGYVGSGSWVEANSFQIGTIGNTDFKYVNSNFPSAALMTIKGDSGFMGVGTTSPSRKLSISTDVADDGVVTVNNANAAGFAGTYYESEGSAKGLIGYVGSGSWVEANSFQIGTIGNTDFKLTNSNFPSSALMTIKGDSGFMGVGTTAPSHQFTVEADISNGGVSSVKNANAAGFAGTYFYSGGTNKGYVGYVGSGNWIQPNSFQIGGLNTDIKFVVSSSNSSVMTIGQNRNVGIGTESPDHRLSVHHGSRGVQIKNVSAGNDSWELYHSSGNSQLQLRNASNTVVGSFDYASGVYMATSDRKLKRNIQPIASVLSSLMLLDPVNYHYAEDEAEKEHVGFIAQEVEKIFPELVTTPAQDETAESNYRMNYMGFGVLAVKAIQEQQAIIEAQQKTIDQQQAKLEAIEKALAKAGIFLEE